MDYSAITAVELIEVDKERKANGAAEKAQKEKAETFNRAMLHECVEAVSLLRVQLDNVRKSAESSKMEAGRAKKNNILMLILTVVSTLSAVVSAIFAIVN